MDACFLLTFTATRRTYQAVVRWPLTPTPNPRLTAQSPTATLRHLDITSLSHITIAIKGRKNRSPDLRQRGRLGSMTARRGVIPPRSPAYIPRCQVSITRSFLPSVLFNRTACLGATKAERF